MGIITVLLVVLLIIAVVIAAFALVRSKQRSGSVLAAPDTHPDPTKGGPR